MDILFNVANQIITRTDNKIVIAGSKNYLNANFTFSADWNGKTKTALFAQNRLTVAVLLVNDQCLVPWEVINEKGFTVSVFGGDLITTNVAPVNVGKSGLRSGQVPLAATPSIYNQILNTISAERAAALAAAAAANAAKDAIIAAAENGDFNGKDGAPGANGTNGTNGLPGESTLLEEFIVSDSNTARHDFTVDIATHRKYRIEVDMPAHASATIGINMFINDDTTAENYSVDYVGNFSSGSNARPELLYINATGRGFSVTELRLINSYAQWYTKGMGNISGATSKDRIEYFGYKTATVSNITKLTIGSLNTDHKLPVGTRISIYRGDA